MTVASLELCKELYELSGWDGDQDFNELADYPRYALGYLQRKLRDYLNVGHDVTDQDVIDIFLDSEPENAAAQYLIEVIKSGEYHVETN